MINHSDILQLCRLCLVEEKVNHSIFEEAGGLRGIFLKITSCLPVSISQDDSLPKKICDSCSSKLDTFYQFWNETANAEKQLLQWLNQTTLGPISKAGQTESSKTKMDSAEVKEEAIEVVEGSYEELRMSSEAKTYVLQQQQLPYSATPSKVRPAVESNETEEPAPKRPRRASAMKALEHMGSEEEDDPDFDGDNYTKAESEESDKDDDEEEEDETYQEPSTSMDDQPGPSGMGKGSTDAPLKARRKCKKADPDYKGCKTTDEINVYPCVACDKNSTIENCNDNDHNIRHLNRYPLECPECYNIYLFRCEYRNHYRSTHEETFRLKNKPAKVKRTRNKFSNLQTDKGFECPECMKFFATKQSYRAHQRVQHDKERFVCDLCGKVVTELASLKNHRRTHSGEKPFMCQECGKNFASKKLLKTHQRIHSGEKPNKCPTCDKRFAQRAALNTHMKYHSGVRPHVCGICQKGYVTKTLLKIHLKKHGVSVNQTVDDKL